MTQRSAPVLLEVDGSLLLRRTPFFFRVVSDGSVRVRRSLCSFLLTFFRAVAGTRPLVTADLGGPSVCGPAGRPRSLQQQQLVSGSEAVRTEERLVYLVR